MSKSKQKISPIIHLQEKPVIFIILFTVLVFSIIIYYQFAYYPKIQQEEDKRAELIKQINDLKAKKEQLERAKNIKININQTND